MNADRICVLDRKSTRLNSSHRCISYAAFCLKKKNAAPLARLPFTDSYVRLALILASAGPTGDERQDLPTRAVETDLLRSVSVDGFFNNPATTEIYSLALHGALPI